jgi:hypothetical protein
MNQAIIFAKAISLQQTKPGVVQAPGIRRRKEKL